MITTYNKPKEDVYVNVDTVTGPSCHEPGCRGYGNVYNGVVFIGIAPGKDEVRTGKPLTGPSGVIFNNILRGLDLGFDRTGVYCTNLICWWKDDPSPFEAAICHDRLDQELKQIKPKLIVLFGKIVAEIFLGRPFGKLRGGVQWNTEYNCYVLTTYHPAALLHQLTERSKKGRDDTTVYDFVRDLRKIPDILNWGPRAPQAEIRYRVVNSSEQAQNVLDNLPRSYDWPIVIDVETKYDKDDDEEFDVTSDHLRCVGVGTDNYCWVFTPRALFNTEGKPAISWPADLWYTMHNAIFDAQVMRQDLGVWIGVKEDTMLQSYSLDERSGIHKLKTLAREYLAAPFWEEDAKGKSKSLVETPPDILYNYNAHDVIYTARLCNFFRKKQEEDNVRRIYNRILIPAVNMYKEVSYYGVHIDTKLQDVFAVLWGQEWLDREAELQEWAKEEGWIGEINFQSPKQLADLLFKIMSLPIIKYTETGQPSTDKEVLDELSEVSEFVVALIELRRLSKMLNAYVINLRKLTRADGRAHPKVKLHSSVNGRPSFTDPALQTIPAPYQYEDSFGHLRELFCATPDNTNGEDPWVLIDADLGKAEIWTAYTYSRDPQMYTDLTGGDYHTDTATTVMEIPREQVTKQDRVNMKRVTFGVMYYREAKSLSKKNGGIDSTVATAQKYINRFFQRNHVYYEWFLNAIKSIKDTGEIISKTGRKRRIIILGNEARAAKQAVNNPIQSTANDVLLDAAIEIHPKIKAIGGHIVLTVHDAIVVEVRQSRSEEAFQIIHDSMTAQRFDGVVPIPVEIKMGNSWGSTKEYHDCSKSADKNRWGGGMCLW